MSKNSIDTFIKEREDLNKIVLEYGDKNLKRFFTLDGKVYEDGAFDKKTKESLGLVASLVLRCDDCIKYHLLQCYKFGLKDNELTEVMNIALIVGGSIVIPHTRRAFAFWDELKKNTDSE